MKPYKHGGCLRVYHTPDAHAAGLVYEYFRVIDIDTDGVLADKGKDVIVFLPWSYLRGYEYQFS